MSLRSRPLAAVARAAAAAPQSIITSTNTTLTARLSQRPAAAATSSSPLRNSQQCRSLHRLHAASATIPKPTPFVPDAATFLTLIGRNLSKHAAAIPSWEALFTWTSEQLKEAGVEPPRARRYLLWWRERYRNGLVGIGGDASSVTDGVAELRIVQVPVPTRVVGDGSAKPAAAVGSLNQDPGMRRVVVNLPPVTATTAVVEGAEQQPKKSQISRLLSVPTQLDAAAADRARIAGVRIVGAGAIAGTGVEPVKGQQGVARLRVREGLWEQRRGHKVDGGERRKAEVRYKRKAAEKKNA